MAKKKNKNSKLRLIIKVSLCLFYLVIIFILCFSSYKLFVEEQKIVKWKDVEKTTQYSSLEISQMSEAFAEIKGSNKTLHFVIESDETGVWHTYLIAINKNDYNKYKEIIDYSYKRIDKIPKKIKLYGYPVYIPKNIKNLAIKNIKNFVPIENQVELNDDNFEKYLTNTYLDTTLEEVHQFNYIILALLILALLVFILFIFTIFDKDKIVDEVDEIIEEEEEKLRKHRKSKVIKETKKSINKGNKNPKKNSNNKNIIIKRNKEHQKKDEDIEIL